MGLTASHGPEVGAHAWDEIHVDLSQSTGALDFQGLKSWIHKAPSGVKQWETQRVSVCDATYVLTVPHGASVTRRDSVSLRVDDKVIEILEISAIF